MAISLIEILRKRNPDLFRELQQMYQGKTKKQFEDDLKSGDLPYGYQDRVKKILSEVVELPDEASLTDEELQYKLEAYGKEKPKTTLNRERMIADITSAVKGIDREGSEAQIQNSAEEIFKEIFNPGQGLTGINKQTLKHLAESFRGAVQNYYETTNVKEDVSRIEDALTARKSATEKESAIEGYISSIPSELQASREEFMKGEEERAFGELERQVPLVLQNLNVRGMLQSGEREDELTSRALNLGSSLEQIQSDLEAEDNQFYYDAAYRNALRKELESVEDYRSAIETKRGTVLKERERSYQSKQSELNRKLEEDLTSSNYARDLALRRKEEERRKQELEDERTSQLISTGIGSAVNLGGNLLINRLDKTG